MRRLSSSNSLNNISKRRPTLNFRDGDISWTAFRKWLATCLPTQVPKLLKPHIHLLRASTAELSFTTNNIIDHLRNIESKVSFSTLPSNSPSSKTDLLQRHYDFDSKSVKSKLRPARLYANRDCKSDQCYARTTTWLRRCAKPDIDTSPPLMPFWSPKSSKIWIENTGVRASWFDFLSLLTIRAEPIRLIPLRMRYPQSPTWGESSIKLSPAPLFSFFLITGNNWVDEGRESKNNGSFAPARPPRNFISKVPQLRRAPQARTWTPTPTKHQLRRFYCCCWTLWRHQSFKDTVLC